MSSRTKKNKKSKYNILFLILQIVISVIFGSMLLYLDMLPGIYLGAIIGILVILILINYLLLSWKKGRAISYGLSVIISLVLIVGGYYIFRTSAMLDKITSVNTEINNINVYVRADDSAEAIEDAVSYDFGILEVLDRKHTDETIDKINKKLDTNISTKSYEAPTDLIDELLKGSIDAIILNEGYVGMFEGIEGYENIKEKIKSIYINTFETEVENQAPVDKDVSSDGFVVYLSGIDTTGPVSTKSRSDVNILMAINPTTRKILLVNTPRDYYVPLSISGGVRDKLTHAGNYGINVSMDTLEMLYGVDVDYYVRLNFTSFVTIIDTLGGVDVSSDYSFNAGGYSFAKGNNHLNGQAALAFARERYSFGAGDRQRGKNQMAVIQAVINKMTSPALLSNYTALLSDISSSIQTNISNDEISDLVKMQLSDMRGWEISSTSVDGTGSSNYTFSMPRLKAYVMVPNEASVNEAVNMIKGVLQGEN
ncbi:LCP family protein [Alloiococcus sp. CFN-8]|uniref:LCP family protein n=1 Tax=Alloiococcus sp. CFN-8 TaxID=3416081 RepID=UPI003CF0AAC2